MATSSQSRARITAGIPGLLPDERERADRFWLQRDYQHGLQADAEGRRRAAVKPDAGRPTHLKDSQKGIELEGWRICARLKKLNPNLFFERSNADPAILGIYHLDSLAEEKRRHICGLYAEANPEFETRIMNAEGECQKTIRGWRTVLAKLIRAKFISEAGAFALFGPPSRDSQNWALFTQ